MGDIGRWVGVRVGFGFFWLEFLGVLFRGFFVRMYLFCVRD